MKTGKFITFEGTEGAGKTTQVRLLCEYLKDNGYKFIVSREPGGTKIGEAIRNILADPENKNMNALTEFLLFSASRSQHIKELIEPHLKKGYIVISDRFADASFAYQGYGRGLDLDTIDKITKKATYNIKPDLTIYLDLDPKKGFTRVKKRNIATSSKLDRIEQEKAKFFSLVRKGYLKLQKLEPKRFKVIDASGTIEEVHEEIIKLINIRGQASQVYMGTATIFPANPRVHSAGNTEKW